MRVLIADCDIEFLDIAKRFLTQCGHQAFIASNGLECIECLRDCPPDVVVLDCELLWGGSDGVCEFMSEEPALTATPVILVTDQGYDPKAVCDADSRIVDRVKKPYSLTQLIKRIQACDVKRLARLV